MDITAAKGFLGPLWFIATSMTMLGIKMFVELQLQRSWKWSRNLWMPNFEGCVGLLIDLLFNLISRAVIRNFLKKVYYLLF